jgi:hypothetical protein
MKLTGNFSFLLAPVLLASVVFAQTRDERAAGPASGSDEISAARSQYTPGVSPDTKPDAPDDNTLAQFRRARPGMQFPRQRGYPRGNYQTPWMDHPSAGHVLIGAAIGFAIGAALGARNSTQNGTTVSGGIMIGGGLFGLIGGCVGAAIGSSYSGLHPFAHRRFYRPSWPRDDEDEKGDLRADSTRGHPELSPPAKPASVTPPGSNLAEHSAQRGTLTAAIRISQ